jgi:hypothetical protein
VADVSPKAPVATGGFDWGDAGIGAGAGAGAIALGITGVLGARRLRFHPQRARMPAAHEQLSPVRATTVIATTASPDPAKCGVGSLRLQFGSGPWPDERQLRR